jgi:hypothetical protein
MLRLKVVSRYGSTIKFIVILKDRCFLTYSLFSVSCSTVFNRLFYNLAVRFYINFLPYFVILFIQHIWLVYLFSMTRHFAVFSIKRDVKLYHNAIPSALFLICCSFRRYLFGVLYFKAIRAQKIFCRGSVFFI